MLCLPILTLILHLTPDLTYPSYPALYSWNLKFVYNVVSL